MTGEIERPRSSANLLGRIDAAWQRVQQIIAPLDETSLEKSDAGGWSIKDNLAHLAAWEQVMWRHHLDGKSLGAALDVDGAALAGVDENGKKRSCSSAAASARLPRRWPSRAHTRGSGQPYSS